jgi:hypothetical protein
MSAGYGAYNFAYNVSTGTLSNAFATYGRLINAGTMTRGRVFYGSLSNSGTITTAAYGSELSVVHAGNSTIPSAYGSYVTITTLSPAVITNAYAFLVDINQNTGSTIGTGYGVYIGDINATTDYAVYQTGTNDINYFAGNLGIGTVAPSYLLGISTTSTTDTTLASMYAPSLTAGQYAQIKLGVAESNYNQADIRFYYAGAGSTNNAIQFGFFGFTPQLVLRGSGNVGIGMVTPGYDLDVNGTVRATSFLSTSDEREKENIKTSPGLEMIIGLRGVSFRWKSDRRPGMGVIAQEVEKVAPELVATDEGGRKSVYYEGLIAPLIESVKELNLMCKMSEAQSQKLASRMDGVDQTIADLRAEVDELKKLVSLQDRRLRALESRKPTAAKIRN